MAIHSVRSSRHRTSLNKVPAVGLGKTDPGKLLMLLYLHEGSVLCLEAAGCFFLEEVPFLAFHALD